MLQGELVVNYPWDATADGTMATNNASSDDATFRYLSVVYSKENPEMFTSQARAAGAMPTSSFFNFLASDALCSSGFASVAALQGRAA
jgi:hypothetical protein